MGGVVIKKYILQHLLLLCFLSFPLWANIDSQIDAIRNAPTEERFKLMNAFKQEVIQMQDEERIIAISKLRSITQSKHSTRALSELRNNAKVHHSKNRRKIRKEYLHRDEHDNENAHESIEDEAEDHIEDETEDHIEDETEDHIEDETENHIEDETEDHIEDETESHIEDETEDHIEDETEDHIEDEHDD